MRKTDFKIRKCLNYLTQSHHILKISHKLANIITTERANIIQCSLTSLHL